MMSRDQILQMIEGYGANLELWPISNPAEVADYIAANMELSLALSMVAEDELILKECFASSEPQWSLAAEQSLSEKITAAVAQPQTVEKATPWWQSIIQRFTDPAQVLQAFPAVVAMLLLMVVVQVVYKDEAVHVDVAYSSEELQDWLVFEGMSDTAALEREPIEQANNDLGELPEFVYYL